MTTIAVYRLPLSDFPLGVGIEQDHDITVELERVVPTEEGVLPFFWVWECTDFDQFERRIHDNRAVRSLTVLTRTQDGRLYQARWNDDVEGFINGMTKLRATLLEGRGTHRGWRFKLRVPEREIVRTFLEYCGEQGVQIELTRLYASVEPSDRSQYSLTDDQYETIRRAYERGYFEEPRGISQTELAASFDISQRAVSRRLRRGLSSLVGNTVAADVMDIDVVD